MGQEEDGNDASRHWFANMNIYQYTQSFNSSYNPIPESGNYAVWLDGSQGTGSAQGNNFQQFGLGPTISQSLSLGPGKYNLSFLHQHRSGECEGQSEGRNIGRSVGFAGQQYQQRQSE